MRIDREPPRPELRFLARFTVELSAPLWDLGPTTALGRRIVPITGGRFAGPQLRGEILDNGADWQVVADDGATAVDTRYLLRTDDGALGVPADPRASARPLAAKARTELP